MSIYNRRTADIKQDNWCSLPAAFAQSSLLKPRTFHTLLVETLQKYRDSVSNCEAYNEYTLSSVYVNYYIQATSHSFLQLKYSLGVASSFRNDQLYIAVYDIIVSPQTAKLITSFQSCGQWYCMIFSVNA